MGLRKMQIRTLLEIDFNNIGVADTTKEHVWEPNLEIHESI